ncbi:DUF5304 family protein, partial [Streptomyces sp. NPDC056453]|uniref:DUF5304 family protein n=1 Tax=Streptomyces sp. NPDC056453 TaxID=3345822 RepID=UPI00369C23BF
AWEKACAEDLAEEKARRRGAPRPPPRAGAPRPRRIAPPSRQTAAFSVSPRGVPVSP